MPTSDQPTKTVSLPKPYPHGIAVHNGIDRLLLTETVRASDLKDAGETFTVVEASTGNVLASHKVSKRHRQPVRHQSKSFCSRC